MNDLGARDRLVMAGLVILGLLTVVAGVVSGRSAIDFALGKDARDAALSWSAQIGKGLAPGASVDPTVLDRKVQILQPDRLRTGSPSKALTLPAGANFGNDVPGLAGTLGLGWILGHGGEQRDEFVSQLEGFAVLSPQREALAVAGDLPAGKVPELFAKKEISSAFADAVAEKTVQIVALPGASAASVAFVPVLAGDTVDRSMLSRSIRLAPPLSPMSL